MAREAWSLVVWTPGDLPIEETKLRLRALRFMLNSAARMCGVEIEYGPRASRFVAASHACPSCKSTNVKEMAPHASDASGYSHRCLSCRQMFSPT